MGPKKSNARSSEPKKATRERSREKEIEEVNRENENYPYRITLVSKFKVQLESFVEKDVKAK